MLCPRALPPGVVYRQGGTVMSETRTASLWQLSIACRLGFRKYDECQTPVASCEDTEEGSVLEWVWIGVSSTGRGMEFCPWPPFWIIPHLAAQQPVTISARRVPTNGKKNKNKSSKWNKIITLFCFVFCFFNAARLKVNGVTQRLLVGNFCPNPKLLFLFNALPIVSFSLILIFGKKGWEQNPQRFIWITGGMRK